MAYWAAGHLGFLEFFRKTPEHTLLQRDAPGVFLCVFTFSDIKSENKKDLG